MSKYIFITGGVVSGLGKGITAASIGRLLKARGYTVTLQKFDPYFNVDSSYMSPYQHGEVFVTEDGGECDLVLGHYERFIDENLGRKNDITSGQIYSTVIDRARSGGYRGAAVQVVPHITDEIKANIRALENDNTDVIITEIGGTVGDIETHPYLEAIRQYRNELGRGNALYIHMTLVPYIEVSHEQKTKPTQRSVKELQDVGIQPDIIICRSAYEIDASSKAKMSLFCNVDRDSIIESLTTDNIYSVPLTLEKQGLADVILKKLRLEERVPDLRDWCGFCERLATVNALPESVSIGIVGKYVEKHAAYVSLTEALKAAGVATNTRIEINWIASETLNETNIAVLSACQGIIIPAGFGKRGFAGKVLAAQYAREHAIPALMIGMGAQAAVVEFARNVCKLPNADSAEFDPKTKTPVVNAVNKDVTFRNGAHDCTILPGTKLAAAYRIGETTERYRHKYAVNKAYTEILTRGGMVFSGRCLSEEQADAFELPTHRFYIGVMFRPEFTSRPFRPHPLITAFIQECKAK